MWQQGRVVGRLDQGLHGLLAAERTEVQRPYVLGGVGPESGGGLSAGDAHETGSGGQLADQVPGDLLAGLVHVVGVFQDEDGRTAQGRHHHPGDRRGHGPSPELRFERRGLRGVGDVGVEGGGQQRQLWDEVGPMLVDVGAQGPGHLVAIGVHAQPEEPPSEQPVGSVGRRRLVALADQRGDRQVACPGQLLDQSGLPRALVPDDLDDPAGARAHLGQGVVDHGEVVVDAGQREPVGPMTAPALGRADDEGGDRPALPLDHERRQRVGGERHRRTVQGVGGGQDLARFGLGHEPGGQVHRVAHDGEGSPELGPHVTGEHRPGVYPDAQRQRQLVGDDPAQADQHPLLVVAHPAWYPRHQDDLAAVVVDVGPEERDLVLLDRRLHGPDDGVEPFGQIARAPALHDPVGAVEVEEGHRRGAVLGFPSALQEMVADGGRNIGSEIDPPGVRGRDGQGGERAGGGAEQEALAELGPTAPGRQEIRGGCAHDDPAGGGRSFGRHRGRRGRPGHDQFAVRSPDEEQMERAGVDADGDAEHHPPGRGVEASGRPQPGAHPNGGVGRPRGVPLAGEEQEHGVAAEFDQAATAPVGDVEELFEAGVDGIGHLLGPDLAVAGQSFRHLGEPGDVAEDHGPLDRHPSRRGGVGGILAPGPFHARSGQVRQQRGRPRDRVRLGRPAGGVTDRGVQSALPCPRPGGVGAHVPGPTGPVCRRPVRYVHALPIRSADSTGA